MKSAVLAILFVFICVSVFGQKSYITEQGEFIFSYSRYDGDQGNPRLRFTLFPNFEYAFNTDGRYIGGFAGLGLRNIGLIWVDSIKHKRRTLSICIPLGFKLGNVAEEKYLTLGAELDINFHYKQKDWINGQKVKTRSYWDDEVNLYNPSLALGYNYKKMYLRLKYQMLPYFNSNYSYSLNGETIYPHRGQNSNIFFVTITFKDLLYTFGEESQKFDGFL